MLNDKTFNVHYLSYLLIWWTAQCGTEHNVLICK